MELLWLAGSAESSSILTYTTISVVSLYLLFHFVIKPYLECKEPFSDIPSLPNNHWLFGSGYILLREPDFRKIQEHTFNDYADAKGRTGLWLLSQRGVVLTDAEDVRTVLEMVTNKSAPAAVRYFSHRAFGRNTLPLINGRHWLNHRAKINRSMHPTSIASMRESSAQVVQGAVKNLRNRVQEHGQSSPFVMDAEQIGKCITVDDWGVTALSHHFRCCETFQLTRFVQSFNVMIEDVIERISGNPFDVTSWLYFLPVAKNIRFREANQQVRKLMKELIEEHNVQAANKEEDTEEEKKEEVLSKECCKTLLDNLVDVYNDQKYDINNFIDIVSYVDFRLAPCCTKTLLTNTETVYSLYSDDHLVVCWLRWGEQNHCLRTLPNQHPPRGGSELLGRNSTLWSSQF